jgi:hypothetical protein
VLEATIQSPGAAGVYPLPLGAYRTRLQPGVVYTWSVSLVLDPHAWSRNVVASATIAFDPTLAPAGSQPASVAALAQAGLWYDAVAAAVTQPDRHAALNALMQQVGLTAAVAADRTATSR